MRWLGVAVLVVVCSGCATLSPEVEAEGSAATLEREAAAAALPAALEAQERASADLAAFAADAARAGAERDAARAERDALRGELEAARAELAAGGDPGVLADRIKALDFALGNKEAALTEAGERVRAALTQAAAARVEADRQAANARGWRERYRAAVAVERRVEAARAVSQFDNGSSVVMGIAELAGRTVGIPNAGEAAGGALALLAAGLGISKRRKIAGALRRAVGGGGESNA